MEWSTIALLLVISLASVSASGKNVCKKSGCSHHCNNVKGKPVCSCRDQRIYLGRDKKTCVPKKCSYRGSNPRFYKCDKSTRARCMTQYDNKEKMNLPSCICKQPSNLKDGRFLLQADRKKCAADVRYRTCNWPISWTCDIRSSSGCKTVKNPKGEGSYPTCKCNSGYTLASNKRDCLRPRKSNSLLVLHTIRNPSSPLIQRNSCAISNGRCSHGCYQRAPNHPLCSCPKGWALKLDGKVCYDYNECDGSHGCEHKCLPDGKGWYNCACDTGYQLQQNGLSCRAADKCAIAGCSHYCNPTHGTCFCDAGRKLSADGKTCVDKDECRLGTSGCSDICRNTDGGFTCSCRDPLARLASDQKTCVFDTCRPVGHIQYGRTSCQLTGGAIKAGGYCTFSCSPGFKLIGTSRIHCSKTGFDYVPPSCQDIDECKLPGQSCGRLQVCQNSLGSFRCDCKPGYRKLNNKCTDTIPPVVKSCPHDAYLQLPANSDVVYFTWNKPQVTDATDYPRDITCLSCPPSEQTQLKLGQKVFKYTYSDPAGNTASCSFKVKVVDVTPPVIIGCPNNTVFEKDRGIYTPSDFVKSIDATDNSGVKPIITIDMPSTLRNPGLRTVNYLVRDQSGNQATCSFHINIKAYQPARPCPTIVTGVTSPATGLALLNLKLGNVVHQLSLPVGEYKYETFSDRGNCTLSVKIYDYQLTRQLELRTTFAVNCAEVHKPQTKSTILSLINSHSHYIKDVCGNDCSGLGGTKPSWTCSNDTLSVTWPTDRVFGADTAQIPADVKARISQRFTKDSRQFHIVIFSQVPSLVLPKTTDVVMTSSCQGSRTYVEKTDSCE